MTTDDLFCRLYEAGCSRGEVLSSDISHLLIRFRADARRLEREERSRFRATANAISVSLSEDADNPYEQRRSSPQFQDSQEMEAFKHRIRENTDLDWDEDLTNTRS